jgi:membrane protease subunit HflC
VGDASPEDEATVREKVLESTRRATPEGETIDRATIRVSRGPGLYFKMPFVDTPEFFPDTILEYDREPKPIVLADKKTLVVDNFARWYIENPFLYRIRLRTESTARDRLDNIIFSVLREELGRSPLIEVIRSTNRFVDKPVLTEEELELLQEQEAEQDVTLANPMSERIERGRVDIMAAVTEKAREQARDFGIYIIDVRIKRADLLEQNLQAVFGRMRAERSRISKAYRSEGDKQASIIRGNTNRRVQVIEAEAERDATKLRGEGDAEAARIVAEAFSTDPDFYRFLRTLDVLEETTPQGTEAVIGLRSGLYQMLDVENMAP